MSARSWPTETPPSDCADRPFVSETFWRSQDGCGRARDWQREAENWSLVAIYQDPKIIVLLSNLTCCQRQWNGTRRRRESSDSEIDVIPSSRVVVVERRSSSWASPRSILELCCNLSKPRGNRGDKLLRHQFSSFGRRWLRVCWAQFGLLPQKVIGRWTRRIQLQSGR